ncbi:M23 family metallopeptidase [Mesorhizobium waimense]|uniref:M23 family metallopeptidase n=1 Tax=Mesorhizobium waimense TaxID=1300307 RepID=A0A3A5KVS9_9HYPH|nr:M23 family metallopeptidase [Mesorhizobium waimense]RJT37527.1 M23 family metallopeptidase [Mesorhizobium waimense]
MNVTGQSAVFGRRKEPHTIIIARGNEIRHFTIRPWLVAFIGSALAAIAIGYLLATSYLVLRDDLIGATTARQARMQQAYEDRISALRAQVDRITSRQLLDQQLMETKVSELLERQTQLSQRHGRLGPILERAESEVGTAPAAADAAAKPDEHADVTGSISQPGTYSVASLAANPSSGDTRPFSLWSTRSDPLPSDSAADRADRLFVSINQSLKAIETEQLTRVATLADNAYKSADAITQALQAAGLPVDSDFGKSDAGGPLIPVDGSMIFDSKVKELDEALDALDDLKKEARKLPLANPAPGHSVTSPFGVRTDPILGTAALHSGMDFRAPIGMAAKVTAPGVVVKAGWNGGYGRMVEVDHGNGFATRYGHLSEIDVTVGQKLAAGDVIGKTGSSGRSTGPHLHYEVRHNGEAVDPLRFLTVGKKVEQYL